MRRRLAVALPVALTLAACGREPAAPAPTAQASRPATAAPAVAPIQVAVVEPNAAWLADYLAAWNRHDIPGVMALFADEATYFDASTASLQRGRPAIEVSVVSVLLRAMPDLNRELRGEPVLDGDRIAFEWTLTGTNTGTWNGVPATRQKLRLGGATVMRVKDGRVVYQADYYDVSALNRQMGWQ